MSVNLLPIDRVLPASHEAEASVIGAVFLKPELAKPIMERLRPDDFYFLPLRTVYGELCAMVAEGVTVDMVALQTRLHDSGRLDAVGGPVALTDIAMATPSSANWKTYCKIVAEKSLQRQVIEQAHNLIVRAYNSDEPNTLATSAVAEFARLHDRHAAATAQEASFPFRTMEEMEARYAAFVQRAQQRSFSLHGWLPTLSRKAKLRQLVPGEVLVIVADTGVGKTALAQNLSIACAPNPVALFSMELPDTLCFERYVQIDGRLLGDQVYSAYRSGGKVDWNKDRLGHIWTCDESGLSIEAIDTRIQKLTDKLGQPPTLTIIDYIQLLRGGGKRYERTSDAAEAIKVLAKKRETIVAVLSQVQRPEDKTAQVEPGLHSAKDSGSIENSAGLVIGIHRDTNNNQILHAKILKNTKGRSGFKQPCNFFVETMEISEIADRIDDEDVPRTR